MNTGLPNSSPYSNYTLSNFQDYKNIPYATPIAFPLDGDGGGAGYGDDYSGNGETMGYGRTRGLLPNQTYWQNVYRDSLQPAIYPITTTTTSGMEPFPRVGY